MKKLFATCKLDLGNKVIVEPKHLIPLDALKKGGREALLEAGFAVEVEAAAPAAAAPVKPEPPPAHLWRYKPEDLKGKNLEQLNMMVVNHVERHKIGKVAPFTNLEEATAWLGQDL